MRQAAMALVAVMLIGTLSAYGQGTLRKPRPGEIEEILGTPFQRLLNAKSLRCTFGDGVHWESDIGERKMVKWGAGSEITFDSINRRESTARMIANQGASDVVVLPQTGVHILETTGAGGVNLYSVFPILDEKGHFVAVASRHISMPAMSKETGKLKEVVLASQYYGSCQVWQ